MKKILVICSIVICLGSCGSGYYKTTQKTRQALDTMVKSKSFIINSSWAQPQVTMAMQQLGNAGLIPNGSSPGNIDISSNTNFFKMANDSVKAALPFFGERQFGGGYNNTDGGIAFEGIPEDLQITKGDKSDYDIRFNIHDKNTPSERYQVFIKLFPNLSSTIDINSTHRYNIQFQGHVKALDVESD